MASADESRTDDLRPRLVRHVRMRYDATRKQHVLLSPEAVWVLNETGAAMVELCDGNRTVAEIEAELQEKYDGIPPGEVRRFVAELVAQHRMEVS